MFKYCWGIHEWWRYVYDNVVEKILQQLISINIKELELFGALGILAAHLSKATYSLYNLKKAAMWYWHRNTQDSFIRSRSFQAMLNCCVPHYPVFFSVRSQQKFRRLLLPARAKATWAIGSIRFYSQSWEGAPYTALDQQLWEILKHCGRWSP